MAKNEIEYKIDINAKVEKRNDKYDFIIEEKHPNNRATHYIATYTADEIAKLLLQILHDEKLMIWQKCVQEMKYRAKI